MLTETATMLITLQSGDTEYDTARRAWNLTVNHRPALIVKARTAQDVAGAVKLAGEQGFGVAVQATGHGTVRPADNRAVLILTAGLDEIRVNAERQTAWVGAGVKWGAVIAATQAHGLTPLFGSSPEVGAVGYTLGGGLGWFGRKFGLAADSVLRFEVVLATGETVFASATEHADLFWALRGGGGAFGVVTGMEIKLYPVTLVYGGNLIYPIDMAREVYQFYREWVTTLPDEFTTAITLMNFPDFPAVPEFLRGKSALLVRGAYTGDVQQGAAHIQRWLDWRAPLANLFRPMPVTEMHTISNDPVDPVPSQTTTGYLRELSDAVIDTIIRYGTPRSGSSPLIFVEIRHMGGAIARADASLSAYSHREQMLNLYMVGMTPIIESVKLFKDYTAYFKRDLGVALTGGVYANFMEGEEARDRARDAFSPEAFARLVGVKAQYDPDNRFGYAFNIPVK